MATLLVRSRDLALEQGNIAMLERVERDLAKYSFPNGSRTPRELRSPDLARPDEEMTR